MKSLVMIPGVNCMGSIFDDVCSFLPNDIKTHCVDCPPLSTLEEVADHIIKSAPEKFYLLGYSFGGYVAGEVIVRYRDRIQGLILIGSHSLEIPEEDKKGRAKVIVDLAAGKFQEVVDARTRLCFHPSRFGEERLMQIRAEQVRAYGAERLSAHFKAAIAKLDRTAILKESKLPILVVVGSDDRAIPRSVVDEMLARLPAAEFVEIPESGHMFPIERPRETANAIASF